MLAMALSRLGESLLQALVLPSDMEMTVSIMPRDFRRTIPRTHRICDIKNFFCDQFVILVKIWRFWCQFGDFGDEIYPILVILWNSANILNPSENQNLEFIVNPRPQNLDFDDKNFVFDEFSMKNLTNLIANLRTLTLKSKIPPRWFIIKFEILNPKIQNFQNFRQNLTKNGRTNLTILNPKIQNFQFRYQNLTSTLLRPMNCNFGIQINKIIVIIISLKIGSTFSP